MFPGAKAEFWLNMRMIGALKIQSCMYVILRKGNHHILDTTEELKKHIFVGQKNAFHIFQIEDKCPATWKK